MGVLPLLIAAAAIVAIGFLLGFLWALHDGQFDDMVTPPMRFPSSDDTLDP
jgi:cbb3-type cytochrome oxidase maturation protein